MTDTVLNRRVFLQSATAAGALVVFASMTKVARAAAGSAAGLMGDIGPFVRINPDNSIVIGAHVPDMGQGTFTSLPMIIAEELDVPFEAVRVEQMPLVLNKNEKGEIQNLIAGQNAGGSNSVRNAFTPLRQAGAKARQMLLETAAEKWRVPVAELTTSKAMVLHIASKRSISYGVLAGDAAKRPEPKGVLALKSLKDFKVVGKLHRHRNVDKIVTGEPLYGIDAEMPGMLHAVIARSPYLDGTVASLDDSPARAVPGVKAIIQIERPPLDGGFIASPKIPLAAGVAVVADSLWAAMKGRDALKISWNRGPGAAAQEDTSATIATAWKRMEVESGFEVRNDGDFAKAKQRAAKIIEARYEVPMAAHACLEPMNALVFIHPDGSKADAIVSTQFPRRVATGIGQIAGIDPLNVSVTVMRSGGGFGRRILADPACEAALISKAVGKPIKLTWTREDDIQHDLYRPGAYHLMQAVIDEKGHIAGWLNKVATQSIDFRGPNIDPHKKAEYFKDSFPAAYIPNMRAEHFYLPSAAPRGWWRAPISVANAFAVESFLDEIAHAMDKDPIQLLLDMIGAGRELPFSDHGGPKWDTGKLAHVIRLAAEKGDWGKPLPKGRGRGFAAHFTFGTYVAQVVEVTVKDNKLSVDRVVAAVDTGIVINPNGIRAQMEGGINDALSAALGQEITIKDGQVEQSNFDNYPMMRIDQSVKKIDVHIVESDWGPSGMGEPPLPPLAPALANAIFAATGKRIRKMPMLPELEKI